MPHLKQHRGQDALIPQNPFASWLRPVIIRAVTACRCIDVQTHVALPDPTKLSSRPAMSKAPGPPRSYPPSIGTDPPTPNLPCVQCASPGKQKQQRQTCRDCARKEASLQPGVRGRAAGCQWKPPEIWVRVQRRTLRIRLQQRVTQAYLLTGFCCGQPFQINTGRLCAW